MMASAGGTMNFGAMGQKFMLYGLPLMSFAFLSSASSAMTFYFFLSSAMTLGTNVLLTNPTIRHLCGIAPVAPPRKVEDKLSKLQVDPNYSGPYQVKTVAAAPQNQGVLGEMKSDFQQKITKAKEMRDSYTAAKPGERRTKAQKAEAEAYERRRAKEIADQKLRDTQARRERKNR
jgi:membrane protein insertase Oxa1/YidC/SpoIIIJ